MLKIKPNCEHCGKLLPNNSTEAMICTFECTFCESCVTNILENVCPNCGGGFEKRPSRPTKLLQKYPASTEIYINEIDFTKFNDTLNENKLIPPHKR